MVFVTLQEKIPVSEFKKIPGVGNYIVNSESFFKYESNRVKRPVEVIGKDQRVETYELATRSVSADFRDLLRIPLLEGRDMLPRCV